MQALLWFPLGRIQSLKIASGIGFVGSAGVGLLAWHWQSWWIGIMAFFLVSQAMSGWRQAQELTLAEQESEAARQPAEPPRPPMI